MSDIESNEDKREILQWENLSHHFVLLLFSHVLRYVENCRERPFIMLELVPNPIAGIRALKYA